MFTRSFSSAALLIISTQAQAWYGPLCYSDRTTQVTITQPSISGETPGDLKVDFDDNANQVKLIAVRASTRVPGAHEVVLGRDGESAVGNLGVILTSPRSTTGYKYELEFRKKPEECLGAMIAVSDKAAPWSAPAPILAQKPKVEKPVKIAKASKPKKKKQMEAQEAGIAAATPLPAPTASPSADTAVASTPDRADKEASDAAVKAAMEAVPSVNDVQASTPQMNETTAAAAPAAEPEQTQAVTAGEARTAEHSSRGETAAEHERIAERVDMERAVERDRTLDRAPEHLVDRVRDATPRER